MWLAHQLIGFLAGDLSGFRTACFEGGYEKDEGAAGKTASTAVSDTSVGVPAHAVLASSESVNERSVATCSSSASMSQI